MKPWNYHPHLAAAVVLACCGCTAEEPELASFPPPGPTLPVTLEATGSAPAPALPDFRPSAVGAVHGAANILPETNAERRTELADQTEKIYLRWNAALSAYRQKLKRLPASLHELQQHEPSLAAMELPRGFQLELDPAAGEIYLTRAAATPARKSTAPPPPANLTVPMAIP